MKSNMSYDNDSPTNGFQPSQIEKYRLRNNNTQLNHENNNFQREAKNKSQIDIKPFGKRYALNNSLKYHGLSSNSKISYLPLPPFALN